MMLIDSDQAIQHIERRTGRVNVVSKTTLKRWRTRRRGPTFVRLEGRIFYPIEALDRWLQSAGLVDDREPRNANGGIVRLSKGGDEKPESRERQDRRPR